jgi:hypothetical protein
MTVLPSKPSNRQLQEGGEAPPDKYVVLNRSMDLSGEVVGGPSLGQSLCRLALSLLAGVVSYGAALPR